MALELFQDCWCREFEMGSGTFFVEVWLEPEGFGLSITLPSAEKIPGRLHNGKLESLLIDKVALRGVDRNLAMFETKLIDLGIETREVALRAVNEFRGEA
jgi:hypothetical protein